MAGKNQEYGLESGDRDDIAAIDSIVDAVIQPEPFREDSFFKGTLTAIALKTLRAARGDLAGATIEELLLQRQGAIDSLAEKIGSQRAEKIVEDIINQAEEHVRRSSPDPRDGGRSR